MRTDRLTGRGGKDRFRIWREERAAQDRAAGIALVMTFLFLAAARTLVGACLGMALVIVAALVALGSAGVFGFHLGFGLGIGLLLVAGIVRIAHALLHVAAPCAWLM